ncbi:helix-turn-helix domain-containing protein [Cryptosporangium sp. NPDC048952]|uniref:helix-turn-helix domain-containing protein n=1 Tax=Cryptosporangium sp. NPDC048952 TaxID=3363961 RepID=UPI00371F666F
MTVGASSRKAWTREDILGLGMTTDLETAAEIIGIGRSKAYQLAKQSEFPVRVRRIGRRYVVPVLPLLTYLEET